MSIGDVIANLRRDTGFMANVTAWETLPARPGKLVEIPADLHPALTGALQRKGIQRLYGHQGEAVGLALGGHPSIAVVTPTASGKTLCYMLPVLHALLNDVEATALFLFPTKALAHDQLAENPGLDSRSSRYEHAGCRSAGSRTTGRKRQFPPQPHRRCL